MIFFLLACPVAEPPPKAVASGPTACDPEAEIQFVGGVHEGVGNRVSFLEDLDGDGGQEFVVGSYFGTRTCIYSGKLAAGEWRPESALRCYSQPGSYDYAGTALAAAGDTDGDGQAELLVGAIGDTRNGDFAGAIYRINGLNGSSLEEAATIFLGEQPGDYAGQGAVGAGDVNGDGIPDLLLGADGNDQGGNGAGKAYLLTGPAPTGLVSLATAPIQFVGSGFTETPPPHGAPSTGDGLGRALAGGSDMNGDGFDEVVLGVNGSDLGAVDGGAVAIFLGPVGEGSWGVGDADSLYLGSDEHPLLGDEVAFAGDLNGDGLADLITTSNINFNGITWILPGPPPAGTQGLSASFAHLTGNSDDEQAGYSLAGQGDVDGDGAIDLLIGAPFSGAAFADGGQVYLARGPFPSGTITLENGWKGVGELEYAGHSVTMGDGDGDGLADALYGAFFSNYGGELAGAACLVRGH